MIIVSNCNESIRGSVTIMYTKDKTYCPACGAGLIPHGWCERKLIVSEETKVFSLRVSYCQKCCRSHRELPDSIIPYKRHSVEDYAQVYDTQRGKHGCGCVDEKTARTIKAWVTGFIAFAAIICQNVITGFPKMLNKSDQEITVQMIKFYVKIVVNNNFWSFSVPPVKSV